MAEVRDAEDLAGEVILAAGDRHPVFAPEQGYEGLTVHTFRHFCDGQHIRGRVGEELQAERRDRASDRASVPGVTVPDVLDALLPDHRQGLPQADEERDRGRVGGLSLDE